MSHRSRALRAVAAVLALLPFLLVQGCSFSYSSQSSSDSSASSGSSSPESAETKYKNQVREYTAGYVRTGGQRDAFRRGLGDFAQKNGITNWEDNMLTYEGIGEGLGEAGVSDVQLKGYMDGMVGDNAAKRAAIQKGYDAKKK